MRNTNHSIAKGVGCIEIPCGIEPKMSWTGEIHIRGTDESIRKRSRNDWGGENI